METTVTIITTEGLFLICGEGYLKIVWGECSWVVDSGSSFHVTIYKEMFISYQSGEFDKFKMVNQGMSNIIGIGDVYIMRGTWYILSLKDAQHIPNMRLNLKLDGKLNDIGITSQFGSGNWKLIHENLVMP